MFKTLKMFCIAALSALMMLSIFSEVGFVFANESSARVSIKFIGDEAKTPGFAQSEITVTPGQNGAETGYYVVYYTDGERVLTDYDEATAIKITGSTVKGNISDGIMLPKGAKGIAVFESKTYFLSETPDIRAAIATAEIPAAKRTPDLGKVQFSFGALSDTHMNYQQYDRGAYEKLSYSMNFFAQKGMDIVVITGDVTGDRGEKTDLEAQYEKHKEILEASSFPADKVYEAIGNHGNTPADANLLYQYLGGSDEKHAYKGSPYYQVLFKGKDGGRDNLFIFMAQEINASGDSSAYDNFSKKQINWLENLLSRNYNDNTNIFITIHSPFQRFGAGDIKNGSYTNCIAFKPEFEQTMRLKMLLEEYKGVIVLSGHSHVSFYENANYSDENNEFARMVHIGSNCQPCGYGGGTELIRGYDGRRYIDATYGSEGYTVEVYSDFIVYTGYNFSTGKKIPAACLIISTKAQVEKEDIPADNPSKPSEENDTPLNTGKPNDTDTSDQEESSGLIDSTDKPTGSKPSDTQDILENETPSKPLDQPSSDDVLSTEDHFGSFLDDDNNQNKSNAWIWIFLSVVAIVVIVVIVVIVLVVVRRKK